MPPPQDLSGPLLRWFDAHGRDLPWRGMTDPYAVWVSEIILQQTRVETGLRYFDSFMQRFPTVAALAAASESDVLAAWSGLGFYRRAKNLHRGARIVVERWQGVVPTDPATLASLPGIGRYTAGAILSSALDAKLPILDGNVIRLLSRVFLVEGAPDRAVVQRELWGLAEAVLPDHRPGDFNQALMDLGATVCTPSGPRCGDCPLTGLCGARAMERVDELPCATKRATVRFEERVSVLATRPDGRFLLHQRPPTGLLASLWELPSVAARADEATAAAGALISELGGAGQRLCGTVEHRFSHRHWTVRVYRTEITRPGDGRWMHQRELGQLGVPTASMKAIRAGLEQQPQSGSRSRGQITPLDTCSQGQITPLDT